MFRLAHGARFVFRGDAECEEAALHFGELRPGGHRAAREGGRCVAEGNGNAHRRFARRERAFQGVHRGRFHDGGEHRRRADGEGPAAHGEGRIFSVIRREAEPVSPAEIIDVSFLHAPRRGGA